MQPLRNEKRGRPSSITRARLLVLLLCGGLVAWLLLPAVRDERSQIAQPESTASSLLDGALKLARRSGTLEALDAVLARAREQAARTPADAGTWRVMADAHLERALYRVYLRGLRVGEPFFQELPQDLEQEIDAGLTAVQTARAHGDECGTLYRIEALLLSQKITSVMSALRYNGAISRSLASATERAGDDPDVQQALGLRKLLSPQMFGHDAAAALQHFERAARDGEDERACVYAGMACQLLGQAEAALGWLERAARRNPGNMFARAVLARLRGGEDDPFGRDVTAEELAALPAR